MCSDLGCVFFNLIFLILSFTKVITVQCVWHFRRSSLQLFTIFGETTQDGENICTLYNYCVPEAAWAKAENVYYSFFPKPAPKETNDAHDKVTEKLISLFGRSKKKTINAKSADTMIEKARTRMKEMGVLQEHNNLSHQPNFKGRIYIMMYKGSYVPEELRGIIFFVDKVINPFFNICNWQNTSKLVMRSNPGKQKT